MLDLEMNVNAFNELPCHSFKRRQKNQGGVRQKKHGGVCRQPADALQPICFGFPPPQVFKVSFMSNGRAH